MIIRQAKEKDADALWEMIAPVIQAGETYALPKGWDQDEALAYWMAEGHRVFVAEENGVLLGTYYLQANQKGGGSHVANCGFITGQYGKGRGIAEKMCLHALDQARKLGFRAMQFNFVVSTNERAVKLWQKLGFEIVGTLPGAFAHPSQGDVDAFVMYRKL